MDSHEDLMFAMKEAFQKADGNADAMLAYRNVPVENWSECGPTCSAGCQGGCSSCVQTANR